MNKIQRVRRLTEMAYLYAWGPNGNADLRDKFLEMTRDQEFMQEFGFPSYLGLGEFCWLTTEEYKKFVSLVKTVD